MYSLFVFFISILLLIEIISRIYYKKRFLVPWKPKNIGEYPFSKFIQKVDSPLYFQFKKGFKSKQININSYGMRGEEPSDCKKKRILLIGESIFFGSKLKRDRDVWSSKLENMLINNGYTDWEVLNAGFPGYNSRQFLAWWKETLKDLNPDILILQSGINDIAQAFVYGDTWQPGMIWSDDFILKQQRKSSWWQKLLFNSCLYFIIRRKKSTQSRGFENDSGVFKLEECKKENIRNAKIIINEAKQNGVYIILTTGAWVFSADSIGKNSPELDALQSNWRESLSTTGKPSIKYFNYWVEDFAKEMNCDALDLQTLFWNNPKLYEMYIDVVHWNESGHSLVAKTIFKKLEKLQLIKQI